MGSTVALIVEPRTAQADDEEEEAAAAAAAEAPEASDGEAEGEA